jgi:hypothetical protein
MAIGVWGGLSARAGFVVRDERGLPEPARDYVENFVAPYYATAVSWYEAIGLGVSGGELFEFISHQFEGRPYKMALNPGHLIHLDEWVNSGVYPDSTITMRSGMAVQLDIIPVPDSPAYFTTNVEDGVALADAGLRRELAEKHPDAWGRIQKRRRFMEDVLGIRLKEEILPFSNMPGVLRPYLLSPHLALRKD